METRADGSAGGQCPEQMRRHIGRLDQVVGFSGQFVAVRFDGDPYRHLSLPGELTTF